MESLDAREDAGLPLVRPDQGIQDVNVVSQLIATGAHLIHRVGHDDIGRTVTDRQRLPRFLLRGLQQAHVWQPLNGAEESAPVYVGHHVIPRVQLNAGIIVVDDLYDRVACTQFLKRRHTVGPIQNDIFVRFGQGGDDGGILEALVFFQPPGQPRHAARVGPFMQYQLFRRYDFQVEQRFTVLVGHRLCHPCSSVMGGPDQLAYRPRRSFSRTFQTSRNMRTESRTGLTFVCAP